MKTQNVSIAAALILAAVSISTSVSAQEPQFDRLPLYGRPEIQTNVQPLQGAEVPKIAAKEIRGSGDRLIQSDSLATPAMKRDGSSAPRMTPAEIRQARAIYTMRNRMARMERDAWYGRVPLRPSFNRIPNASALTRRPTVIVPYYLNY